MYKSKWCYARVLEFAQENNLDVESEDLEYSADKRISD